MAQSHGKNASVIVDTFDWSTYLDKLSMSLDKDLVETTTFSTSATVYKTRIPGPVDGKLTFSGFVDTTAEATADTQFTNTNPKVAIASGVGQAIGNRCSLYLFTQADLKDEAAIGSAVTWSFDGSQSGGVDRGVYLHTTLAAETGAPPINSTAVDWGAASTGSTGFAANLCVTAFTGTNAVIKVQDSADNITFADVTGATFTTVTGTTSEQKASTSQTVRRYTRSQIASGTYTSVTFALALAKRS